MTEASTLKDVIDEYAADGCSGEFGVGDDPLVSCYSCGADNEPGRVTATSSRRIEGASDPADMATVYAVACPACDQRGTLVLRYGPEATAAEAEVSQTLRTERHGDGGYSTPAEDATTEG